MKAIAERLRREVRGPVSEDTPTGRYTTVRIGGPADILVEATCREDVAAVCRVASETGTPMRVLGAGSNVLISDRGVRGIVLHLGRHFRDIRFDGVKVFAEAGATLPRLAKQAADRGLAGIEFGGGIPGTVGGAVVMNAGAHGGDVSQIVREVYVVDSTGETVRYDHTEMQFSYRRSRLSGVYDTVVVGATFELTPDDPENIRERMRAFALRRRETQPLGLASSGSVFKNPPGDYAGRLIEAAGLKGLREGQAMVSDVHGNFIVNLGGATSDDVLRLIDRVRQQVENRFGIQLQLEVELVGM